MNNIFFTADTHFFHKNILKFCRETRLGVTVEEMNEILIESWNMDVKQNDYVYHLGDFSFGNKNNTREIIKRLNGNIHLIEGNHDKVVWQNRDLFESFNQYKEIKLDKQHIVLFHFPIETWHRKEYGSLHFCGHVHGALQTRYDDLSIMPAKRDKLQDIDRRMDIGVDSRHDMRLWSWEEIKQVMKIE